nr:uncharacterized protein LOC123746119 [Procambarus clarkii]
MEKILDEWTPYASLDHVHTGHWRTLGVGGRGGGRGRGAENNEHFRNEKIGGCREFRCISQQGRRGDTSAGAIDPRLAAKNHDGITTDENDDSRERRRSSWRYRQEASGLTRDRRARCGSAEGRAARKMMGASQPDRNSELRNNWLTEASVNHIDDFHSDDFTDRNSSDRSLIRSHRNFHSDNFLGLSSREKNLARSLKDLYSDDVTLNNRERQHTRNHDNFHCDVLSDINSRDKNSMISLSMSRSAPKEINSSNKMLCATTQTPLTMSLKKPTSITSLDVRELNAWMSGSNAEDEDEDAADFGYVKRGIRFWDAERRQREEEREKKMRVAKWRQKEEEKRVREEEWIYKEEDTVWVAKADKSIRQKNQRERQLQEERTSAEDRSKKAREMKERLYSTRKGLQSQGNYWRIGYGDKAINKELRVVRISDEQLTSF